MKASFGRSGGRIGPVPGGAGVASAGGFTATEGGTDSGVAPAPSFRECQDETAGAT